MSVFNIYSTYLTDEGYGCENQCFEKGGLYHYKFVIHDHYIPRTVMSHYSVYGYHPMVVNCHGYLNAPLMYKTNAVYPIYYDTEINENLTSTLNITKDGSITVTALNTYDENLSDYENLDNVEVTINGGQFNGTNAQRDWYNIPFANSSPKTITYKLKVNTYGRRGNVSDDTYLTPPYASLAPFISYRDSRYTYEHEIYIVKLDNGKSLICADIFRGSKRNIADDGSAVSTTDITIVTSNELNIDWSVYHDIKIEYFFKKHPSYDYECTYIKLSIDNTFIPFHSLLDSGNLSNQNSGTYYCDTDVNSEYYGYLTIVTRIDNDSDEMFYNQNACASTFVNIGSYDGFNTDAKNTKWNVSIKKLEISDIDLPTTWKFYSSRYPSVELPQEGYSNFLYFTPGGYNQRHVIKAKNNYGFEGIRCYYSGVPKDFYVCAFYNNYPNESNTTDTLITSDREFRLNESNTYFSLEKDIGYYGLANILPSYVMPFETDNRTYLYHDGNTTSEVKTYTVIENSTYYASIIYSNVVNTLENTEDVTFENEWCKLNGTTNRGIIIRSVYSWHESLAEVGITYELFFKLTHDDIVNIKNNLSSPDGHIFILCTEKGFRGNNDYIALLYKPNLIVGNEDTLGRNILGDEIDGWFEVCRYNGTYSVETYALYPKLKSQDVYHLCYMLRNYGGGGYNAWNIISLNGIYLFVGDYNKLDTRGSSKKLTFFTNDTTGTENKIFCSFRSVRHVPNYAIYPNSLKIDAICNTHLDTGMPTEGSESFYRKFVDNRYKHVNIEALYPDNKLTLPTHIYSDWMTLEASKFEWIETVNGVSRVVSTADEYEVPLDRSKVVTLSCTNAYAVNKKLNITITMLIPPTAIIKPITDLTYIEYGQYIELDGSDSYENITRYQWSTGEQTDKIGFYIYGDTTKTLTVYNEYGYNATTFTIRGVLMSQTLVSLNNLTRYSNNLKPKTVTDLTINSNKITVKYLDNHTKQLTLPSGGSSVQTRTVTRIPTYIELHVNVGHVEDEGYLNYSITTNSKVTISAEDIKDIFKFSSDNNSYATGITVTDITASKAYDENDTVFLIAVNMVSPIIYDIYSSFLMSCNKSFGNVTLTDSNILSAVNSISSEEKQSITSQVYGGESLTLGGSCGNINYGSNYCVVDAVISTDDLGDEGTYIKNNYFKYDTETNESYCYLKLIFKSCLTFDDTAVTFTEVL